MRLLLVSSVGVLALAAGIAVGAPNAPRLLAQSAGAAASDPTFETASVKPNKSGDGRSGINIQPGGRFVATGVTLQLLIAAAYGEGGLLPDFQISGGPNWIGTDRFDIVAKAASDPLAGRATLPEPGGAPPGARQMNVMLRALLAERFRLTVHHETRQLPIYELVVARSDGTLGPQLRETTVDCVAAVAARGNAPPRPDGPFCGTRGGVGRLMLGSVTMSMLATVLSRSVNRTVVDRTGLAGKFDGSLEWTPDQMSTPPPGGAPPGGLPPPPADGPSIFTAVQEQLGLKLESARGPVDVLVIDHVERPTPN